MGEVIDLEKKRAASSKCRESCADGREGGERFCRCGLFRSGPMRSWSKEQTAEEAILHLTALSNMPHLPPEARELITRLGELLPKTSEPLDAEALIGYRLSGGTDG